MITRTSCRACKKLQLDHLRVQRCIATSIREFSSSITRHDDLQRSPASNNQGQRRAPIDLSSSGGEAPLRIRRELVSPPAGGPDRAPYRAPAFRSNASSGPRSPAARLVESRLLRAPAQLRNRRHGAPRQGRPGTAGVAGGRGGRVPQRRRREAVFDDEDDAGLDREEELAKMEDPKPDNQIYEPKELTLEDIRQDWPAMPIGPIGMTESVTEQARWLARRFPHGYNTHQELAQRLHKGEMVHFHSEEEKEEVVKIAQEMAKERADRITERPNNTQGIREPEPMDFVGIGTDEKASLGSKMVKGDYPPLEQQRLPLLNSVARTLRNNGTYGDEKSAKLMRKVIELLPANRMPGRARQAG